MYSLRRFDRETLINPFKYMDYTWYEFPYIYSIAHLWVDPVAPGGVVEDGDGAPSGWPRSKNH